MRRVILNLATSLDGRIIDANNQFDWIYSEGDKSENTEKQFDFSVFLDSCDTIVLGKTAYEDLPSGSLELFSDKRLIVLTHTTEQPRIENIEFFSGDLVVLVKELKQKKGKNIWVFSGASVCNSLVREDLIDNYIIGMIPIIVGDGTRLFADGNPLLRLHLE